jgi:hypothetical protein
MIFSFPCFSNDAGYYNQAGTIGVMMESGLRVNDFTPHRHSSTTPPWHLPPHPRPIPAPAFDLCPRTGV